MVTNQFGEIILDTINPDRLLVPSLKDLDDPISDDDVPDPFVADHFKCYSVEVTEGTENFEEISVSVWDQFEQPTVLDVRKPRRLCNPVSKDDGVIGNPDNHLLCYKVTLARGELKFKKVRGIYVNNQFGPLQLDAKREKELCVPSVKDLDQAFLIPPDDD